MHGLTIVKSLLVRVFLLAHGLICAWRVIDTNDNQYCWIILVGLGFLLVETGIVIWLRNGQEFKTYVKQMLFFLNFRFFLELPFVSYSIYHVPYHHSG
jgi:hypothetical protein